MTNKKRRVQYYSKGEPKKLVAVSLPQALAKKFEEEARERQISVSWLLAQKLQETA